VAEDHDPSKHGLLQTLAHHDAAIGGLSTRVGHVETGIKAIQSEMSVGFKDLSSKFAINEARPQFNFHQTVSTITTIAVLFSMIIGGIIWIVTGQFALVAAKVDRHDATLERMAEKLGWASRIESPRR